MQRPHLLRRRDVGPLLPASGAAGIHLPDAFRFHDLRHDLAILLIGSAPDVKVQHRLRHGSARTTLDTCGRLWPDRDESARATAGAVLAARAGYRTRD